MDKKHLLLIVDLLEKQIILTEPMADEEKEAFAAIPTLIGELYRLGQQLTVKASVEAVMAAEKQSEEIFTPWKESPNSNGSSRLEKLKTAAMPVLSQKATGTTSLGERLKKAKTGTNPTVK